MKEVRDGTVPMQAARASAARVLAEKERAAVQNAIGSGGQPAIAEVHGALSMAKNKLLTPFAEPGFFQGVQLDS